MKPESAKRFLEWWAGGASIGEGVLKSAIIALVHGEPDKFVDDCIKKRFKLEGKPIPSELMEAV